MNYMTEKDVNNINFYKVPKVLFSSGYSKMSNNSRMLYSFLRDKTNLSIKNGWKDKEGNVYIYYSIENLSKDMLVSERSIKTWIKELIDLDLIESVRQGANKANKIYVGNPKEVCANFALRGGKICTSRGKNLPPNKTKVNKTKKSKTESLHFLSENDITFSFPITEYINIYLKYHKSYLNKEHVRVKESNLELIEQSLKSIAENIDLGLFEEKVEEYFESLPKSNNGSIISFLTASKRIFDIDSEFGKLTKAMNR